MVYMVIVGVSFVAILGFGLMLRYSRGRPSCGCGAGADVGKSNGKSGNGTCGCADPRN